MPVDRRTLLATAAAAFVVRTPRTNAQVSAVSLSAGPLPIDSVKQQEVAGLYRATTVLAELCMLPKPPPKYADREMRIEAAVFCAELLAESLADTLHFSVKPKCRSNEDVRKLWTYIQSVLADIPLQDQIRESCTKARVQIPQNADLAYHFKIASGAWMACVSAAQTEDKYRNLDTCLAVTRTVTALQHMMVTLGVADLGITFPPRTAEDFNSTDFSARVEYHARQIDGKNSALPISLTPAAPSSRLTCG